jgi:peptide/nickel transport system substrate-binding protein
MGQRPTIRATRAAIAGLAAVAVLAAGCGGVSEDDDADGSSEERSLEAWDMTADAGESGLDEAGEPQRGGTLTYGIEGETNGGFCLSEGQLAISGMLVVRALYDTLTVPNEEGDFVPYLARSVEPNDDFTEWTITLREGIEFHDGSPLTAEVVKNNLDAYRGTYENRSSLLFMFVLRNITDVSVVDDLTVQVDTEVPWVAFPAYLYSSSRLGIMAQSQLDDPDTCTTRPVGTGPFRFVSWNPNEVLVGERNEDYWQIAPDGEPYPYADRIEFRPIPDFQVRNQAIESGAVNLTHTTLLEDIGGTLRRLRDEGQVNMLVSQERSEISFLQINGTRPPFDDLRMRRALAHAVDRDLFNDQLNAGLATLATGPFSPDSPAHLEDTDIPDHDPEAARALVEEYEAEGNEASVVIVSGTTTVADRQAALLREALIAVGFDVDINNLDQAAGINAAIAKQYDVAFFRNYPGEDPDSLYVWWYSGTTDDDGNLSPNLVNFAGIADEVVDETLDAGRSEPDPDERTAIYQRLNERMSEQIYALWLWYTTWAVVTGDEVHGILGPPLPGDDISQPGEAETDDPARRPNRGLATGHSLIGLWVDQG